MDSLSAIIYGLIQGITEFLPVSSSGHLALLPHFLTIKDPGVLFDLAMHVGTALSIVVYFRKEVILILHDLVSIIRSPQSYKKECAWTTNMIVATFVTFGVVLCLKSFAEEYAREAKWISINLIVFGLLMFFADRKGKSTETKLMGEFTLKRSILIGFSQALAIFPGVSRSGATLTMARFLGLGREESTRFSFLLSLPIILAGFFYKLPSLLNDSALFDWSACLTGMGVSFIVGLVTIHYFLKLIKKIGLGVFTLYRIVLAVFVLNFL
jgi:undecaprenyl-diphosphatase